MGHLDEGILRRLLDEPSSVSADARAHYQDCEPCRKAAAEMAADARAVGAALGRIDSTPVDVNASFAQLARRIETSAPMSPSIRQRLADLRWRSRRFAAPIAFAAAAAAAIALLAFTPVGTLAQSFLTIFEPRQFVAIPITRAEMAYLPDLESFGTIAASRQMEHRSVATSMQAAALTGIAVRMPTFVPPNVPRRVYFDVGSRAEASFKFSSAKARTFAARSHRPVPAMPPGLDGSTLTLQVGPMVVISYGDSPAARREAIRQSHEVRDHSEMRLPPLVIVQSVAPHVASTGATALQIEAYILQMPGVSPQLADEIRAIGDPSTTMPIPVPIDKAFSQNVFVDGVTGLAIGDDTGVGGMIVWQKKGIVYGVGGALPQRALMEVAQSLR